MPTPFESAQLNLKLYELRREPLLREARDWFSREFNPSTFDEMMALVTGPKNTFYRMVLGYWDMAASLVTFGAIDAPSFLAANGEVIFHFAKIQPFLEDLRRARQAPEFCKHMEAVVLTLPNANERLERNRETARALAARATAAKK